MPRQLRAERAFTLIEMMIVVVVVAILTALALPDEGSSAALEGKLAAERLDGDVAYCRSCSIVRPDDPMIIKFDPQNNRYWIARKSNPDTPVPHPVTKEPYLVQFGDAEGSSGRNVTLVGVGLDGDYELGFDATGSIDQSTPAAIQLRSGSANYEITVSPAAARTSTLEGFRTELQDATYKEQETANFADDGDGGFEFGGFEGGH